MTLLELIKRLKEIALSQPNIRTIVDNDIYRLNQQGDYEYGVFAYTQGVHTGSIDSDFISYNLTLFYVDRLKEDYSNQVEIQSAGVSALSNIIRTISEDGVLVSDYRMTPFNQDFSDVCAGVFTEVSFSVPAQTLCAVNY